MKNLDLVAFLAGTGPVPFAPVHAGYGSCSACSCPAYSGGSSGCSNWGCGHHYNLHW